MITDAGAAPAAARGAAEGGPRMGRSVLLVDDEPGIVEIASAYLRQAGFTVRMAVSGARALQAAAAQPPDLVILDLRLPDISGEEVCIRLRRSSAVPILMLTAKSAEEDRLRGLALGADDYLVKPFSPRELVARVRAILRRAGSEQGLVADLLVLDRGRLEIDLAAHRARVEEAPLTLTSSEFRLLVALARQPGRVWSRFDLLEALQGPDVAGFERTIDAHVKNLRRKLEAASPGAASYVETVYGVGYRLAEEG
jgi:DNA-binding response OmpR family regulator